jgi:DNA-binding transcriptional ArsR family regulator
MPTNAAQERQDSQRNKSKIRTEIYRFIKRELRKPTVQELVEATGLSDKTVKAHLRRLKLGNGSPNPFQVLTPTVILKLYERAVGYQHQAEKILTVAGPKGEGSSVERHEYTEHYPPDVAAAKLWVQLVEGFKEKTETEHTGSVGFNFTYQAPAPPEPDGEH